MLKNWLEHQFYFGKAKARFVYHFDGIDDHGIFDSPITLSVGDSITFTVKVMTDAFSKVLNGKGFLQFFPSSQTAVARLYDDTGYVGAWRDSNASNEWIGETVALTLERTVTGYLLSRWSEGVKISLGELASSNSLTITGVADTKSQSQIYDIEVTLSGITTKWAMDNKGEAVQPSIPSGNNLTIANMNSERWNTI